MKLESVCKFCLTNSRRFLAATSKDPSENVSSSARGTIVLGEKIYALIKEGGWSKGAMFSRAQLAGISAARKTPELIPSVGHADLVDAVSIRAVLDDGSRTIVVTSTVRRPGERRADTEAMLAVAIAALTICDVARQHGQDVRIRDIGLAGGGETTRHK